MLFRQTLRLYVDFYQNKNFNFASLQINMKKILLAPICFFLSLFITSNLFAQKTVNDSSKLFSVSGFGYGFNSGNIHNNLHPHFSSDLGVEYHFKKSNIFLMGALDLLSYGYYQDFSDQVGNPYRIKYGSSTFYMFELTPGYRFSGKNVSFYGFVGPGVGLLNLPNITVNTQALTATQTNKYSWTASAEAGLGLDFNLGSSFVVFLQGRYMHNFSKVQDQNVNLFPLFLGLKSNITAVLKVFASKKNPPIILPAKF